MKYLFLMMSLVFSIAASSQTDTTTYGYVHGALIQTEIPALFMMGPAAWKRFLQNNLKQQDNSGTVTVAFTVNLEGNCSDVELVSFSPSDIGAEAVRLIKKSSGLWVPAVQNGHHVRYRNRVDIVFNPPDNGN
jgi:TonB family protein